MEIFGTPISGGTLALLLLCLTIALAFEFVNGFHDTANAVATVIYTKSLKPGVAVAWSGFVNFLGVLKGATKGAAVAFTIIHILPVALLISVGKSTGLLMVLSLLLSAMIWNLGTWYFGLPSSSSHALIGSILGVGVANSLLAGNGFMAGINWPQVQKIGLALIVSPIVGFGLAALLLLISRKVIRDPRLYEEPKGDGPPPPWIRTLLFLTCTGVSFSHGSNDGQKGIGLIMLVLIGLLPTQFALNHSLTSEKIQETVSAIHRIETKIVSTDADTAKKLEQIAGTLAAPQSIRSLSQADRDLLRASVLKADSAVGKFEKAEDSFADATEKDAFKKDHAALSSLTDFVAPWVPYAVALALGLGTMVGWKRIVVTVGEKIGKAHLTYGQGAVAELVAAATIAAADGYGLPVSTTHVLSSGIAGTMAANRSGLQTGTIRNIALAWLLTLPATMLIAGTLFAITAGTTLRNEPTPAPSTPIVQPSTDAVKPSR